MFIMCFEELLGILCKINGKVYFTKYDVRATGRQFLGWSQEPPFFIIVITASKNNILYALYAIFLNVKNVLT